MYNLDRRSLTECPRSACDSKNSIFWAERSGAGTLEEGLSSSQLCKGYNMMSEHKMRRTLAHRLSPSNAQRSSQPLVSRISA